MLKFNNNSNHRISSFGTQKLFRNVLLTIALLLTGAVISNSQVTPEFKSFWNEFSKAVKIGDKEKVAEMIVLPFQNEVYENEKLTKDVFFKYYHFIISKEISAKNSIKSITVTEGTYWYEEWGNNCDYRITFEKINGKYKAISIYSRGYETFEDLKNIPQSELDMADFEDFFNKFKAAVVAGDAKKMADMAKFPLEGSWVGEWAGSDENGNTINNNYSTFVTTGFKDMFGYPDKKKKFTAMKFTNGDKKVGKWYYTIQLVANDNKNSDWMRSFKDLYLISYNTGDYAAMYYISKINGVFKFVGVEYAG